MRYENFLTARLTIDNKTFEKYVERDDFYSFENINATSMIVTFDKQIFESKNCPQISSRVYSLSKLFLYRGFDTFASRYKFYGDYNTRLLFT